MCTGIILLTGLMFFISCSKDNVNEKPQQKSPAQLLTQKQWLLTRAGFDDNNNGVVDDGLSSLMLQPEQLITYGQVHLVGLYTLEADRFTCGGISAVE
jgi:hypothetical protein